ncbi:MAG: type II secretion system protein GspG [Planctomycetota bacterium]
MTRRPLVLSRRSRRRGFTLLEVLIVLAILAVIAAMVVPNVLGSQRKANEDATRTSIYGFEQALKLYAADNAGEYPTGGDEVVDLLLATTDDDGNAVSPLLEAAPKDAWGKSLHYEYPNTRAESVKPAIWSEGANGIDEQGGGDDVTNWEDA